MKSDVHATPDSGPRTPDQGHQVILGDNLAVLKSLPDGIADLIYIDPPFNTGKQMERRVMKSVRSEHGKVGFHGATYERTEVASSAYNDRFDDYLAFLEPRLREAHRILAKHGTLYFHIDYREVHYCKVLLDQIFSRKCFLNEVIWAYDYGARSKTKWPTKHDNILVYVKDAAAYHFSTDEVDRLPYMAPGLVSKEKAERGKLPTDTWWHTIVPTNSHEKTGYPTQKPFGILRRMVAASSRPGDLVVDFFAGSGTAGAAAVALGRRFLLIDSNPEAVAVMRKRFAQQPVTYLDHSAGERAQFTPRDPTTSQRTRPPAPAAALPPANQRGATTPATVPASKKTTPLKKSAKPEKLKKKPRAKPASTNTRKTPAKPTPRQLDLRDLLQEIDTPTPATRANGVADAR